MKKKTKPSEEIKRLLIFKTGYGFVTHGANAQPLFPTHTHGLTELGMPEIIFDPLAFGAEGNTRRIIKAYEYFSKSKNAVQKLDDLQHGITISLNENDLVPGFTGESSSTFCLRKVSADFEGVKLAYYPDEIEPGMWFVQMYFEGDNFALTDEYYRGGVKW